jgi:hypothetical protein
VAEYGWVLEIGARRDDEIARLKLRIPTMTTTRSDG